MVKQFTYHRSWMVGWGVVRASRSSHNYTMYLSTYSFYIRVLATTFSSSLTKFKQKISVILDQAEIQRTSFSRRVEVIQPTATVHFSWFPRMTRMSPSCSIFSSVHVFGQRDTRFRDISITEYFRFSKSVLPRDCHRLARWIHFPSRQASLD